MLVTFSKNSTLVCAEGETCVIHTAPQPMGDNNFVDASMLPEVLFDQGGGGGTAELSFQGQGSNDGENWYDISGFSILASAPGAVVQKSSAVTSAFVRFKVTLNVQGGAAGDWVVGTFDLQANLTRKNG